MDARPVKRCLVGCQQVFPVGWSLKSGSVSNIPWACILRIEWQSFIIHHTTKEMLSLEAFWLGIRSRVLLLSREKVYILTFSAYKLLLFMLYINRPVTVDDFANPMLPCPVIGIPYHFIPKVPIRRTTLGCKGWFMRWTFTCGKVGVRLAPKVSKIDKTLTTVLTSCCCGEISFLHCLSSDE
jgi:hypothetical protein